MIATEQSWLEALIPAGVIAILRTPSADPILDITAALIAGGVTAVEVTLTTPGALKGIESIADRFGDQVLLGAGTVMTAEQCRDVAAAGARYVISPHLDPMVVEATKMRGLLSIPGAFTPSEIVRATALGADLVKIFPATTLGPGYIRDIMAPMPHLKLMPTGGVSAENVGQWLSAGATCVGVGTSLVPKSAVERADWGVITENARAFQAAIAAARP